MFLNNKMVRFAQCYAWVDGKSSESRSIFCDRNLNSALIQHSLRYFIVLEKVKVFIAWWKIKATAKFEFLGLSDMEPFKEVLSIKW